MAKKKNPEQEAPPAQDQEPEIEQQEETPAEESPAQEEQPQDQNPEEQGDPADEEEEQAEPGQGPDQEQPPAQEPASDEATALRGQLLQAQGELAAYRAGVAPGMVADAVTLAMAEASKAGEVTEAAVAKAMDAVLKRHPEWKADTDGKKKTGGFKLGADRDSGGAYKKPANDTTKNVKRWNRFK